MSEYFPDTPGESRAGQGGCDVPDLSGQPDDGQIDGQIEIEITSLRPRRARARMRSHREVPRSDRMDVGIARMTNLARRVVARRRMRQAAAGVLAVCAVLLALGVGFARTPDAGSALQTLVNGQTPTPLVPLAERDNVIALEDGVPWGKLRVDGKVLAVEHGAQWQVAVPTVGPWPLLVLPPGRHTLEYDAAPFTSVRCTLSVPVAARSDTCPLSAPTSVGMSATFKGRVLDVGDTPQHLSAGPLHALESLALQTVATTSTAIPLQVGDHYLGASGRVETASTPMLAQQKIFLSNATLTTGPAYTSCRSFCVEAGQYDGTWPLSVLLSAGWRYTRMDGTPLSDTLVTPLLSNQSDSYVVSLAVLWDGGHQRWQLAAGQQAGTTPDASTNPSCAFVGDSFTAATSFSTGEGSSSVLNLLPPQSSDEGCALAVHGGDPFRNVYVTLPPSIPSDALFLYRCGALVAVNAGAQQMAPKLPKASAHEVALATAWGAQANATAISSGIAP